MTKITKEEVKKVAHLARLELNEDEINNHAEQLEKILEYIKQLEKIETDDVPCTTRAIEVVNVFRKDEKKNYVNNILSRKKMPYENESTPLIEEILDLIPKSYGVWPRKFKCVQIIK